MHPLSTERSIVWDVSSILWVELVLSSVFVLSHKAMERQDNGMNGHITNDGEIAIARNGSQTSQFRRERKENVLSLGLFED